MNAYEWNDSAIEEQKLLSISCKVHYSNNFLKYYF